MLLFYFRRYCIVFTILFSILFFSCSNLNQNSKEIESTAGIAAIKERGKLVAATGFSGISFFIYKGDPMGFQFELLSDLARKIGVPLEIVTVKSIEEAYILLANGGCDIVAMNLVPSKALEGKFLYTTPHSNLELAMVSLRGDSSFTSAQALDRLNARGGYSKVPGRNDDIVYDGGKSAEKLVDLVAQGDIHHAIVEESEARVGALRFSNIKVNLLPGLKSESCWAVNGESTVLLKEVDTWLNQFKKTASYGYLLSKYKNSDEVYTRYADAFITPGRNQISKYDHVMKHYGEQRGWDWKLIAAIVYQESRFDAKVVSGRGAQGLMQIMPITAEHFGVDDVSTPHTNIKVGVMLLNHLKDYFLSKGIEESEAIKFVLGAYNSGLGHIEDARRLAEKYDSDPNKWEDVAVFLRMKSQPKYYRDPVVKYGKFSGRETSKFVVEVLERYGHYRSLAKS